MREHAILGSLLQHFNSHLFLDADERLHLGFRELIDYGLIFGHFGLPRLGIAGAGWGSVGAEAVTFLYLTLHTLRRGGIDEYGLWGHGLVLGTAPTENRRSGS